MVAVPTVRTKVETELSYWNDRISLSKNNLANAGTKLKAWRLKMFDFPLCYSDMFLQL